VVPGCAEAFSTYAMSHPPRREALVRPGCVTSFLSSSDAASSHNNNPFSTNGDFDEDCTLQPPAASPHDGVQSLSRFQARMVRLGLQLYVLGMCLALPATLLPQRLLRKARIVSQRRSQIMALSTGQFCSRWLLRLIPFCSIHIDPLPRDNKMKKQRGRSGADTNSDPEPAIWVCNHMSMLDVFVLLGVDRQLRGNRKRPIKIVYWKGLEANPVTRLLFRQAGFIPVQMADNGNGNDNEYDVTSFKKLLKDAKGACTRDITRRGRPRPYVYVLSHTFAPTL
jgi:Acyltransferase